MSRLGKQQLHLGLHAGILPSSVFTAEQEILKKTQNWKKHIHGGHITDHKMALGMEQEELFFLTLLNNLFQKDKSTMQDISLQSLNHQACVVFWYFLLCSTCKLIPSSWGGLSYLLP